MEDMIEKLKVEEAVMMAQTLAEVEKHRNPDAEQVGVVRRVWSEDGTGMCCMIVHTCRTGSEEGNVDGGVWSGGCGQRMVQGCVV